MDDTKVIAAANNENDYLKLKYELEPIYEWSDKNDMGWNNSKFKELRIGCSINLEECLLFTPGYENVLIPEQYVKDLGVLVDN